MRTYQQIKLAVLSLGFKWFEKPFSLNMVQERTNFDATNKFTDLLHVCYKDEHGGEHVLTIPWTTKPGLKGSLLEPITTKDDHGKNVTGTAVIISPQQVLAGWEFRDVVDEFSNYPYFRQRGLADYWRDGDKDLVIDKVNEDDDELFGTHWHRMSQTGTYGSGNVNNWSLGCQGAPEPEFKKILPIVRQAVKLYGPMFTGTIIESQHII